MQQITVIVFKAPIRIPEGGGGLGGDVIISPTVRKT